MEAISYAHSAKQAQRIENFIENPDSTSGVLTQPSVIHTGETVTVPAGRTAILANTQIDGTLTVDGTVFIPSGTTLDRVVEKVTSTDNAIVRFDGATGKVQNSGVIIDDSGNLLLTSATGGLGYGTGAGGTVTQFTSKSTPVTLNKPTGQITMHNSALAAGASVTFILYNNLAEASDTSVATANTGNYDVKTTVTVSGTIYIKLTNISGGSLSDAVNVNFVLIKGAKA